MFVVLLALLLRIIPWYAFGIWWLL